MTANNLDPNITQMLQAYGFSFAGNDESGLPLFTAPNGQIVTGKVATDFVQQQEKNKRNQAAVSPEEMPSMPNIDSTNLDSSIEKSPEKESLSPESQNEKNTNQATNQVLEPAKPQTAPPKVKEKPKTLPFGEGHVPKSFDAASLQSTRSFVQQNATKSDKLSNKWLAVQFQKFIEQYEESLKTNKK